jgi:tRNA A-37 threonylcarbamoyl transferase component Bud32
MRNPSDGELGPEDAPTLRPPLPDRSDSEMMPHLPRGGLLASTPGTFKTFGDYELLEEIARGGMGVVYRARHRKLNRIVALKMILSGEFASSEAISRFYVEAEAAASLDHPGITPVYEIGEIDNQPFFAMKLITGGSVQSSIAKYEKDTRCAVSLLTKVSRAVHHAHQRGILHRDLKPSNILLDETGDPLITDFGLAKITHRDSENTKTGAMMGTPAYTAPEQVAGNKNITIATDIYSIGAILYRLLTGRQTYEAENALDIMIKSMSEDPVAPRQIKPDVPIDLDLICMKCLERDPNRRYSSAESVAEDLERWSRGEPVSVRAASLGSLAGVWVKRNLQMAGGAAIVGTICGLLLALLFLGYYSRPFHLANLFHEEYFPSVRKPLLAFHSYIPTIFLLPLCLVGWPLVVSMCGFLSVFMTRPPNRNAAASVGLIAGMFCAGFSQLTGVIGPIQAAISSRTSIAMRLVEQASRDDPDLDQFSQQAILHFYPDLATQSESERGQLLLKKIDQDLLTGIPIGLWAGTLLFLAMMPAVVLGATYAWKLMDQERSFTRIVIRYIDMTFSLALFILFLILYVFARLVGAQLYVPSAWLVCLTLFVMFAGICFAGRSWSWPWRITSFIASAAMVFLYVQGSEEAPRAWEQADDYVLKQEYSDARDALGMTLMVNGNDHEPNYRAAILEAFLVEDSLGNRDDYRMYCKRLVEIGYWNPEPGFAERAAKAALLLPGNEIEVADAVALAEKASALDKKVSFWILLAKSMAKYRNGEFDSVIQTVHQFNQKETFFIIRCTGDLVKAMALHRLGNRELAKKVFVDATLSFESDWNQASDELRKDFVFDKLVYEIWRKECEKLLATDSH